jgi:glycerate kinase
VKIVVAMNAFKGSLSAVEATSVVARGFKQGYREADTVEVPMADGGDGTAEVLTRAFEGRIVSRTVTGPYGGPVEAQVGVIDFGQTVVIESAKASGLALTPVEKRDVRRAQSRGVGELMLWAATEGVKRIIAGIGGTAMNDGGIGAVQAAGGQVLDREGRQVESGLGGLFQVDSVSAGTIRSLFQGIEVIAACDVNNPLIGEDGATRVYGPQKGLRAGEVAEVDRDMERYASILARDLGRDPSAIPMTGAGGGLAAALWAFFGARLVNGAKFLMTETGLLDHLEGADLVITGEGKVDFQTAKGKLPFAVARAAAEKGIPAIAIGGALGEDVVTGYPLEFSALFSTVTRPQAEKDAMSGARENLAFIAEQIGRLARVFAVAFPVETDESAGGIVVREEGGEREVLLIADRFGFAALPKGHPEAGETLERVAVREVHEETGIQAEVLQDIGPMTYRFPGHDGRPIRKTVHYYLMKPAGGALKPQAGETLEVMWVRERDLPTMKTYRDTHVLVGRALEALDELKRITETDH